MPDFTTMVARKNPEATRSFQIPKAVADRMQKELECVTAGGHNRGLRWETVDRVGVVHFELDFQTTRHLYILPSGSPTWKNKSTLEKMLRKVGLPTYTSRISAKLEKKKNDLRLTKLTWEEIYEVVPHIVLWSYEQQTGRSHPAAARFRDETKSGSTPTKGSTPMTPHQPIISVLGRDAPPSNIEEESIRDAPDPHESVTSEATGLVAEQPALDVMRSAVGCNHCFETISSLERVPLGLPKPRWIGSRYGDACPRVVIVLLNPGDGTRLGEEWNRRERKHFDAFFDNGDYDQVRDYFRIRRGEELNRMTSAKPVFSWYESVFGLVFEEIAQINMAWCASKGNMYQQMLQPCFERHTRRLLQALEPHVVLLSGANVHRFQRPIEHLLPGVDVRQTLHYAHRNGKQAEAEEGAKVRAWLQEIRAKRRC